MQILDCRSVSPTPALEDKRECVKRGTPEESDSEDRICPAVVRRAWCLSMADKNATKNIRAPALASSLVRLDETLLALC